MFKFLFLLFLLVPLTEILVLIEVGGILGAVPTVALCIFTAALGTLLLRAQGIQTLRRAQNRIEHGEMPATDVIEGLILLVAGILLLTPGFMTDLIGFFCLIPGPRTRIATGILVRLIEQRNRGKSDNGDTIIIEGEFREETDKTKHRVTHEQKQRED